MNIDYTLASPVLISIIALTILCAGAVLSTAVFSMRVVKRRHACDNAPLENEEENLPGVSVVVYCQDEADALEKLLQGIFAQEYHWGMEVIVVNEGESSDVRNVVGPMQISHRNLYLTNTPDGAHNLSRKKLALTLAVKAARYPVVLLTTVDTAIDSELWIYSMMRGFGKKGVEVVLGYAAPVNEEGYKSPGISILTDYGISSMVWISAALAGHPFRGSEYNLAYTKDAFFKNKGFCKSLNLHFGDDDIFINEIADRKNTLVQISSQSILGIRSYDFNRSMRQNTLRRCFTEHFIRGKHNRLPWASSISGWLWLAGAVTACVLWPTNLWVLIGVGVTFLMMLILPSMLIGKGMRALNLKPNYPSLPFLLGSWPLRKIRYWVRARVGKQKRFTWE